MSEVPVPEVDGDGQTFVLHVCEVDPTQAAPPFDGTGLEQVRDWVPPPQVAEQMPNELQPPSTGTDVAAPLELVTATLGHASVLHACEDAPEQAAPPS